MKIGVVAPGHFKRLGAEIAFLHAWFHASQKGFPAPDYIGGVSAGGIAAACAAQWTEEDFKRTEEILLDLKRSDFYSINPELKLQAILAILPLLLTLVPHELVDHFIDKIAESVGIDPKKLKIIKLGLRLVPVATTIKLDEAFVRKFLTCESIFSNDNLHKLLIRSLSFKRIFDSPIKIEIASADVNNKQFSIVTNYKPEHQDSQIFTRGIVDSTRLPVFFPFRQNAEGNYLADGAAIANMPFSLARGHGCDLIVVLKFNCVGDDESQKKHDHWVSGLQRFIDMSVDEVARKAERDYEYTNRNLAELEVQKKQLEDLGKLLYYSHLDSTSAQAIRKYITAKNDSDRRLSYFGKKKIPIISVESELLPEFHFSSFDREQTRVTINKGYNAFENDFMPKFKALNLK